MAMQNNSIVAVWEVKQTANGNIICRVSTSRKLKDTGEYWVDYQGYVFFKGKAKEYIVDAWAKRVDFDKPLRIRCLSMAVTSTYNKDEDEHKTYITIWNAEDAYKEDLSELPFA